MMILLQKYMTRQKIQLYKLKAHESKQILKLLLTEIL